MIDGTYNYLKPYCKQPNGIEKQKILIAPYNLFGPLFRGELEAAEVTLGRSFPDQLRKFYLNIGVGSLMKPHNAPEGYDSSVKNDIFSPITAANFSKGILEWDAQENWMAESTYELLEPGDLPFFEMYNSTHFLVMKLNSDNPNAVWTDGSPIKIEDSFEKFIWRLYYESPSFYGDIIGAAIKNK